MPVSRVLALSALILAVFVLNTNFVINHLFEGGYLEDAGFFVGLVHHNIWLDQPVAIGTASYYKTHFTPWLSVMSAVSYLTDLPAPHYYALTQGFIYAVLAYAGWRALEGFFPSCKDTWKLLVLTFLFTYNGIAQSCIHSPHFEALYAAFAVLFLVSLAENRMWQARLFFILTLGVREDAGLHLFGILFLLAICTRLDPKLKISAKTLGTFAVFAFLVPCAVLVTQKVLVPGTDNALRRIYLGDPAYAHLTWDHLSRHLPTLMLHSAYLWPAWILLGCAAWFRRSTGLAVGFFSVLPWLAFNALAIAPAPSLLSLYYGFPVIVTLLWPSLWVKISSAPEDRLWLLKLQTAILVLSFSFFTLRHPDILANSLRIPQGTVKLYQALETVVDENLPDESATFDSSWGALFPDRIPKNRLLPHSSSHSTIVGFVGAQDWGLAREASEQKSQTFQLLASSQRIYRLGLTPSVSPLWSKPTRFPLER